MSYLFCPYCGKDYEASLHEIGLWWVLEDTLRPAMSRQVPWPTVTCLTIAGKVAHHGYAATYRWNAKERQLEVLVMPGRDAKFGRFWPVGLVLWRLGKGEAHDTA